MDRPANVAIAIRQLKGNTGAVRHARVQVRLFHRLGAEVDVYSESLDRQAVRESGGIPHPLPGWPLGGYWRRRLFNSRVLRRIHRKSYDLVIGHGDIMEQDVLCLHNCVHLAHELIHGRAADANHVICRLHGELLSRKDFRLLVANSNLMRDDITRRFDIDPERVGVVHRGHDPVQFNGEERDARRPRLRETLGLGPEEVLIGLVTSGDFEKRNVEFFLRCVSELPAELGSRCHCLIVGRERRIDRYRSMARELGLDRRAIFSDFVAEVQDIFHALDIYVLPAKLEEFGRSALEAMACGLPVVTSDRVGCAELFPEQSQNFVLPSGDEHAFIQRIAELVSRPELRQELGQINRAVALQNTEHHEARNLEKLLRERGLIQCLLR
jgi:UDP-glucose:(heptosyl)LPS alpha-1,3-glucosyltransferase